MSRFFTRPLPEHLDIDAGDGPPMRVRLRRDSRARRYLLRVPPDHSGPVLTVPENGSRTRAEKFLLQHLGWLRDRLVDRPAPVPLVAGNLVPVRGKPHLIVPTGGLRGIVSANHSDDAGPQLLVPGETAHIPRKVLAYLKKEARSDLTRIADQHARTIGKTITGLSVRDTRSRWGSCTSTGRLSFSWRLILAPPEILDYVAAHEVAHLVEMNHSARFWRLCEQLAPQTPHARRWLKTYGSHLHAHG
ncbi:metal-dependent hydrolase [Roseibium aquae]|uniref:Metal-dependent hydrolase n=2 Tax=Roseibium aquae TaxID=1323746 RepID=A0A916TDB3_9HYPH|nr:SprT family zinc-dependent metalloprotease [Roseibium aquae]GGB40618.1 metal-dependent hydrolase [Roseibium aquae]